MAVIEASLWDIEDATTTPRVKDTSVGPVSTRDVAEFCRRYHYTRVGNNLNWRYGLWSGPTLLGVVSYNLPTRRTCASVFGPDHLQHVWHMGRLVMADVAPRNSESRLIGGSLRRIQSDHSAVWAVLTYAAVDAGHIGYVYQATNAIYTGTGGDTNYYVDKHGSRRGTHLDGHRVGLARAAQMGWTKHEGGLKHRYVYLLGNRSERRHRRSLLKLSPLPYPKLPSWTDGQGKDDAEAR